MQDIDFEALDDAVNKIMHDKKAVADEQAKLRKRRSVGRNMDVINVAHKDPSRLSVKKPIVQKSTTLVKKTIKMQDVRPKQTSVKTGLRSQRAAVSGKPSVKSVSKPMTTHSIPQARGADLIRRRRRMHNSPSLVPSAKSTGQSFVATKGDSVVKGHYQTKTLSTKKPDGSETIYQHSEVDYVAKIAQKPTSLNQIKPLSQYNFANLDDQPINTATQSAKTLPSQMVSLDTQATAKPAVKTSSTVPQSKIIHQSDLQKERSQSPFIETVKVDKRPLGAPYDKSAQATFKVEQSNTAPEAVLYRDDLRTEEQPSKLSSIIWIILTIVAILGAAAGIYLLTVYNK